MLVRLLSEPEYEVDAAWSLFFLARTDQPQPQVWPRNWPTRDKDFNNVWTNDIPYFLEFVGYEEGADEKGLDYAKKKPQIVTESMREFSKERYAIVKVAIQKPMSWVRQRYQFAYKPY